MLLILSYKSISLCCFVITFVTYNAPLGNNQTQQYYPHQEQTAQTLELKQYECMVFFLGQLSGTYHLEDIWAFHDTELQRLIDYRAACAQYDGKTEATYVKVFKF